MIQRDRTDFRQELEHTVGRLPRRVAYPLIFLGSVLLWSLIGIVVGAILRPFLQ